MELTALLRSPLLLVIISSAHLALGQYGSYNYGFDVTRRLRRQVAQQQQQPLVVVRGGGGGVQLRQEIRQLEQNQDQWTLYILGLSLMQFTDQTSPTSWYGITGIHGIPHKTWGGVGPTPGNEDTGYCTHSSVLFPTWHRPYLALYEQVLYSTIQMIATWWPEGEARQRYMEAAATFRIPYWDWALNPPTGQSVLPLSVGGSPYVDVNGPSGVQRIANPLFSFTFKPLNATAFLQAPWDYWTTTLRSPTTNNTDALSNNSQVALNLDQNVASLSQRLYILFSNYGNYSTFSNNAWIPLINDGSYDSLEALHDTVHNLAGGGGRDQPNSQGGHMAYIPYSAFDPIFFLHHTMIDRIFAIWQALYPNSWVTPQEAALPSFTTARGQVQDVTTPLTPFFANSDRTFWTSATVRDHTQLGYTYAELVGKSGVSNATREVRSQASRAINRLYGASSPASLFIREMTARRNRDQGGHRISRLNGKVTLPPYFKSDDSPANSSAHTPRSGVVFVGNQYREWIANIYVKKQALNGPFSIHLFLGDVSNNPTTWASTLGHVGTMGVFASDARYGGMDMSHLDISGTIPLTTALVNKVDSGELSSLEPLDVERYLRRNLKTRIVRADGKVIERERIDSLGIRIVSSVVRAPETEDELPVWGRVGVGFHLT
ncbi:hypothetical protein B0T19DRAFT_481606 [Cercophora scortea]|uniref:Tyrosinase copper-binding domain-containing protein n=1 Tax=Cercophora scortea TaxID=314031 RepID=A0AAE0J5C7_9PEZI|nr:hypothetical protein B0T19DRAFT_481606 [Cercophora scortea]